MKKEERARRRAHLWDRLKTLMGGIRVYALVGKSGTGKSFRAKLIAERFRIDYIIDDGLLIHQNSIVAGKSAKRERIYMSAVRTALFDDPLHRHEVVKAIQSRRIRRILLLGTSERMIARTAERLQLPLPVRVIHIEEISSPEDIEKAQRSRNEEGKHVIPVPLLQVERNYPQLLSKSIKILFKMGKGFGRRRKIAQKVYEKAVVQPFFQNESKGKLTISEQAIGQLIAHCADEFNEELTVKKVKIRLHKGVYQVRAEIKIPYGNQLTDSLHELHGYIVERIERFTGIIIGELNLVVAGVTRRDRNGGSDEHEIQGDRDGQ